MYVFKLTNKPKGINITILYVKYSRSQSFGATCFVTIVHTGYYVKISHKNKHTLINFFFSIKTLDIRNIIIIINKSM